MLNLRAPHPKEIERIKKENEEKDKIALLKTIEQIRDTNINQLKKEEFYILPQRDWNEDIEQFDSLVILPTDNLHDSGYLCMDFVAVKDHKPIIRLSGCSDALCIDGIGGYGNQKEFENNLETKRIDFKSWQIDCLPCGLLRLFSRYKLTVGSALSTFEVWGTKP